MRCSATPACSSCGRGCTGSPATAAWTSAPACGPTRWSSSAPPTSPITPTVPPPTVERRGALRVLLDDLARLPELQRHALLRRELDGVSHDDLAAELGLTTVATRSLVHRARGALLRAAEGRALGCHDVRPDLLGAHDGRRRPTARTLRHLATCPACRALHSALRAQRRSLAVLAPPVGLLAALGGLSLAGWHTKATAIGTTAVVAAGVSIELFQAGDPVPVRAAVDRATGQAGRRRGADPEGRRRGPRRGPLSRRAQRRLSCPPGLKLADLLPPEGGRVSAHYGATTTIGADGSGEIVLTGPARDVTCGSPRCAGARTRAGRSSTRRTSKAAEHEHAHVVVAAAVLLEGPRQRLWPRVRR